MDGTRHREEGSHAAVHAKDGGLSFDSSARCGESVATRRSPQPRPGGCQAPPGLAEAHGMSRGDSATPFLDKNMSTRAALQSRLTRSGSAPVLAPLQRDALSCRPRAICLRGLRSAGWSCARAQDRLAGAARSMRRRASMKLTGARGGSGFNPGERDEHPGGAPARCRHEKPGSWSRNTRHIVGRGGAIALRKRSWPGLANAAFLSVSRARRAPGNAPGGTREFFWQHFSQREPVFGAMRHFRPPFLARRRERVLLNQVISIT